MNKQKESLPATGESGELSDHVGVLVFVWFVIAAASFGAIYYSLYIRISDEERLIASIQAIAWPFVWFALALPAAYILMNNLRQLMRLKRTLEEAPEKLELSLQSAETFTEEMKTLGAQINNDLSAVLDAVDAKVTALRERINTAVVAATPTLEHIANEVSEAVPRASEASEIVAKLREDQAERDLLYEHVEYASSFLYPMLERWNSDGRRQSNVLRVSPGGGNRSDLARQLLEKKVAPFDDETSALIANYESLAFQEYLGARKRPVDKELLERLDAMRRDLDTKGVTPELLKKLLKLSN